MANINIELDKCRGCKSCINACPFAAIVVENKKGKILENCTLCGSCIDSCKFEAIKLKKDIIENNDIDGYKGVWIFAEQKYGTVSSVAKELLGQANNLAKSLETQVAAVIIGNKVEALFMDGNVKVNNCGLRALAPV